LNKEKNHIVVFEHEAIRFDAGDKRISEEQFIALQKYFGKGVPYFGLRYNGIQFNEYVGVIQVGKTIIEVLPKADKNEGDDKKWRNILTGMLAAIGNFDVKATSQSNLKLKPNNVLDLYFKMFIEEVEYLLHNGLIKQYRKKEGNVTALKGSLQFGKHLQQNLTHQERFYVRHSTYDVNHAFHFILYKTIKLLKQINTNMGLQNRIGSLLLHFPEMPDIKVTDATFKKLAFTRKNMSYKKAIEIAKLLLLQYHPDVSKGRNNVLALMFDMNKLWEQFVYVSLRKHKDAGTTVSGQSFKYFWNPEKGNRSKMIADIVINKVEPDNCFVLDTKWKNLNGYNPSPEDLRQLYVYHEYYGAKKVALIYPGNGNEFTQNKGKYLDPITEKELEKECSVILLPVEQSIKAWQASIADYFKDWCNIS
jgi:5-methylcytosine-specific restriction enzyme subunit McrC